MECKYCGEPCRRSGWQKNGVQRYFCKKCSRSQQNSYRYRACNGTTNNYIRSLSCESVGIRGISRVLGIAKGTVSSRMQLLARAIRPPIPEMKNVTYEVDELWTYISNKENEYWVAYALNRKTRQVVDFIIGKRTKATLKELIDRLLLSKPKIIRTDRLTIYQRIIPKRYIAAVPTASTGSNEKTYRFALTLNALAGGRSVSAEVFLCWKIV